MTFSAIPPRPGFLGFDWGALAADLDAGGAAVLEGLLTPEECAAIAGLYPDASHFRSHVQMARHGFGRGEYRYFRYPLPDLLAGLRGALYGRLAPIANRLEPPARHATRYPAEHAAFLATCHAAGQTRPTPLLLQYRAGDFNCLHQDLYGELPFPLQVAILLSAPGQDFTGGEFVLTEQRPRMQTRAEVVPLTQGTRWPSPCTTARSAAAAATTASTCAMASAGCGPASGTRWA